jgi:predicted nucleic acid-binding protein
MLLVDTNILYDLLEVESRWKHWSLRQLKSQSKVHELVINPIIYAELAPAFSSHKTLDDHVEDMELGFHELPRPALYLAGIAHRQYREAGGPRESILCDFLIGAHAAVLGCGILTRDARRYRKYFPRVALVTPA